MATFQDAYTRLLLAANRPSSETDVLQGAKDAINDAILFLQRNHAYLLTELVSQLDVPASSFTVDLSSVIEDVVVRDIMSVQQVSADGVMQGLPIQLMTYAQLQAKRMKYDRSHATVEPFSLNEQLTGWTIEDGFRCDKIAFISGQNLGIYPTPNQDTKYVLNIHQWMPALSDDSDTNFFLVYAYDVVVALALKLLCIFMKEDNRFSITEQSEADMLAGLIAWDSQLREAPITTLA